MAKRSYPAIRTYPIGSGISSKGDILEGKYLITQIKRMYWGTSQHKTPVLRVVYMIRDIEQGESE
jgi:hypothetical protein